MPAISTGRGWVSQAAFYTAYADAYSDFALKAFSGVPNVIFGIFSGDWNGNGGPTSLDQSDAIQGALSQSLQKIAIKWKIDAETRAASQRKRGRFLATLAGLLVALSLVLPAFPNFLKFDRTLFGALAILGYILLAFAVAEAIEDRWEALVRPLPMTGAALIGCISVALFYIVHLAEDIARNGVTLGPNQSGASNEYP
ncbi:hypothetical protein [Silvibacterium acidisoli]|uniref:hypothetical protein n=1 Tax=Acidobacteriaceae bacterium ZG23-2 TaxID=2883246 RepID=UPI00406C32C9